VASATPTAATMTTVATSTKREMRLMVPPVSGAPVCDSRRRLIDGAHPVWRLAA
jgi:hypothetical protein